MDRIPPLDIRDIAIIDALPVFEVKKEILNIGCGEGRIDFHLMSLGYNVYATDIEKHETWMNQKQNDNFIKFSEANIFDLSTMPVKNSPVVICSEVLEHLKKYKDALNNLLQLAEIRIIITVPYEKSFCPKNKPAPQGHCNFWSDKQVRGKFKDIKEFHKLCRPYSVSISKIRTKKKDVEMKQYGYLIVVDKRQNLIFD